MLTINWKKIMPVLARAADGLNVTEEEQLKIKSAVQAFMFGPYKAERAQVQALVSRIQGVSVSTDFPVNITNLFNMSVDAPNYDAGYEAAFQNVQRDETKQFWEIVTGRSGLRFRRIAEGGRLRVETISGDEVLAYVDFYGGALGWTQSMIQWRKIAVMMDKAQAFRNAYFINKADNHYLLLAAAARLHVTAYQVAAGATQLVRDIATLNLASANLGLVNKDKGYPVTGQTPFILYASPLDEDRLELAFAATKPLMIQGGQTTPAITGRLIRRVYTYNQYITQNHPILVLPGQKIQKNEALAPTTYNAPEDVLTLNKITAVWTIYGAAIADDEQCMQIDLV